MAGGLSEVTLRNVRALTTRLDWMDTVAENVVEEAELAIAMEESLADGQVSISLDEDGDIDDGEWRLAAKRGGSKVAGCRAVFRGVEGPRDYRI